ncbi:uncharacterized protein BDR25DRAFT_360582 [Lindgomyces ingoldianus]|uniref:Uncharacterized protein n=1 Tax=Lindgomyces ingoldianus TaxID=673940 RepID=A0ACB6QHN6_9PLEO|nr:uncharacterized protein BDR25DRAFT_360582 [Lindgomyces ingoldianus]KAF2465650.1 hypothetical protein BDR25DRAFT_360582 [Lindgomyces ingoldianus]
MKSHSTLLLLYARNSSYDASHSGTFFPRIHIDSHSRIWTSNYGVVVTFAIALSSLSEWERKLEGRNWRDGQISLELSSLQFNPSPDISPWVWSAQSTGEPTKLKTNMEFRVYFKAGVRSMYIGRFSDAIVPVDATREERNIQQETILQESLGVKFNLGAGGEPAMRESFSRSGKAKILP